MEKQLSKLIAPLFLFIIFFMLLGFCNRYASDDFEFLFRYNDLGFIDSVKYFYDNWNTRWIAISWMNLIFYITAKVQTLLWYHVLSFIMLWIGFFRIVKQVVDLKANYLWIISGFAVMSFFYSCFSVNDVFFWINTSTMYLWSVIALIFIIGAMLNNRNFIAEIFIIAAGGAYIGGAYEPLAVLFMILSFPFIAFVIVVISNQQLKIMLLQKTGILFFFILISFLISYSGEGHAIRATFLPEVPLLNKIPILAKAIIKMLFIKLPEVLIPCLIFSAPWFIMGMIKPFNNLTIRILKRVSLLFIFLIIASLSPVVLVMSEMGPERSWTQISVYLIFYCAIIAAYAGSYFHHKKNQFNIINVYAVIILLFTLISAVPKVMQAFRYRDKYDVRMKHLGDLKNSGSQEIIFVEPLPQSGWLHSAEISEDPWYFTNQHLKRYLNLPNQIAVKKDIPD